MENLVFQAHNAVVWKYEQLLRNPLNIELEKGKVYILYGPNGVGKSVLASIIAGKGCLKQGWRSRDCRSALINCSHAKDMMGSEYYHQQRWNSIEQDSLPLVEKLLPRRDSLNEASRNLWSLLNLESLLAKRVIFLSSGELRRLQIAQMIFSGAQLLILDDMFVGLDSPTEQQMEKVITGIARETGATFLLIMPEMDVLPAWADSFIHLDMGELTFHDSSHIHMHEANSSQRGMNRHRVEVKKRILSFNADSAGIGEGEEIVSMNNVCIQYGGHSILTLPQFVVKSGENWAITGNNGSGKSTLFSIICADNPQSYSCDLRLFGRARGTGESIWEIKKHIGYVSPELHRAYSRRLRSLYVVATGFDASPTLGLKPTEQQLWQSGWWMQTLGILDLSRRLFCELSFGEQQMVLLARAFVNDPLLLVLDEPMQGLDCDNISIVREAIESFCSRAGKSLIMITHNPSELPTNIDRHLNFPIE